MPYIIIIDKMGTIKETNIKEYKEEDLYRKANFKSAEGFDLQTTWTGLTTGSSSDISVSVYGKKAGKAMQENKYEFPPPIDSVLFFGGCVLVAKSESDDSIVDLRVSSWNKIYETLMGGFEDLDMDAEEDEEEDHEEEEDIDPNLIGKNGYMKDGFVVEDEDDLEEEFEDLEEDIVADTESEEEEVKPKKKSKRKPATTSTKEEKKKPDKDKKKKSSNNEPIVDISIVAVTDNYLDCSSELVEEAYV